MTTPRDSVIIERRVRCDPDGLISYHYQKGGKDHRRVVARLHDGQVLFMDPATKIEYVIGVATQLDGMLILILPL